MRFEHRVQQPVTSSDWEEAAKCFLKGRSRLAWEIATGNRRQGKKLVCPDDWLLAIEISRANCRGREAFALSKLALREHPDDPLLQICWGRTCLSRGFTAEAMRFLEDDAKAAKERLPAFWAAELGSQYASALFAKSSETYLSQSWPSKDDANVLYMNAWARYSLREWDEALELARQALGVAPRWQRARVFLCSCLLSRGRLAEAEAEFSVARSVDVEDALLDFIEPMYCFSIGNSERAEVGFKEFLDRWPKNDYTSWVRQTLFVLWQAKGETDRARELLDAWRDVDLPAISNDAGERVFLPLTLMAQNPSQCVPTAVAMVIRTLGHSDAEPDVMFGEMGGREGTALWRMRRWLLQRGLQTVAVKLEIGVVKELLREGVPLIGVLQGLFEAHVDVLCGFDDQLDVFYVRDPMYWVPGMVLQSRALERYEAEGCVYAIIDSSNVEVLQIARAAQSDACESLLDLSEAVGTAALERAEEAFGRIDDDSIPSVARDQIAVRVVISPQQFLNRSERLLESPEFPLVLRFRALMSLRGEEHRELLTKFLDDEKETFGQEVTRIVQLVLLMRDGDWQNALRLVDRLLKKSLSIGTLWVYRAEILAELGDSSGSAEALDRAIELMPRSVSLRERALQQNEAQLTWHEYLAEFDRLIAEDPSETSLLWGRALALFDGPDGRAFEESIREYLRWYPRDPAAWQMLAQWFLTQRRFDLADVLVREGRKFLNESELPWKFVGESECSASADESHARIEEKEVPKDRDGLFRVIRDPRDLRSRQAIDQLEVLRGDGALTWFETAQLCSARILVSARTGESVTDMDTIFPSVVPGPPHWFASSVAESVTGYRLDPLTARALGNWIDRVVPDVEGFQNLWFQRILLVELETENQRAIEMWETFLTRFPESSSAHYRLGCIKQTQADFRSAIKHYQRSLESNPGLVGALENLSDCARRINYFQVEGDCLERLREKWPYSFATAQAFLLHTHRHAPERFEEVLGSAEADFPSPQMAVLKAAANLAGDRPDESRKELQPLGDGVNLDDTAYEEFLRIEFEINARTGDLSRSERIATVALERWPDSVPLKAELAATVAQKGERQRAHTLFGEVIRESTRVTLQNAYDFLTTSSAGAFETAVEFLQELSDGSQSEVVAEAFTGAMTHSSLATGLEKLLLFCRERYPKNEDFSARLVEYYYQTQSDKAVQLARELHDARPEHPHWAYVLGRVLINRDAKEALPYLERAYARDHSGDLLFELGRCHQILGNREESVRYHWENLEQDPMASSSLTALVVQGEAEQRLWPYVNPALEAGLGVQEDYFHVSTVLVARSVRESLTPAWITGAVRRMELLQTYPGYRDERRRLRSAVRAWEYARPQDLGRTLGSIEKLRVCLFWPGTAWVPKEAPDPST